MPIDETNHIKIKDIFDTPPLITGRTDTEITPGGTGVHGHMFAEEIALSLTPGGANTYIEIPSTISAGVTNGITFQNSKELKVDSGGTYLIVYSISARMQTGTSLEAHATIMIDGSAQSTATSHITTAPEADTRFVLTGSTILTLAAAEKVSLAIKDGGGTAEFIIEDINCSVVKLS